MKKTKTKTGALSKSAGFPGKDHLVNHMNYPWCARKTIKIEGTGQAEVIWFNDRNNDHKFWE